MNLKTVTASCLGADGGDWAGATKHTVEISKS